MSARRGTDWRLVVAGLSFAAFVGLAALVAGVFAPLYVLDAQVAEELHGFARRHLGWTGAVSVWTDLFGPLPWRVAVGVIGIVLVRKGRWRQAVWVVGAMAVAGVAGAVAKAVVGRARPIFPDPVAIAPQYAFPSGHVISATVGAGLVVMVLLPVLSRWGRVAAWVLAGGMAVSMAYTRMELGVHWLSDAVGGVLLSVAILAAALGATGSRTAEVEGRAAREEGDASVAVEREGVLEDDDKSGNR